jgi:hypothetical protein
LMTSVKVVINFVETVDFSTATYLT